MTAISHRALIRNRWLFTVMAGLALAILTLMASVWGSLSVLSFVQDSFDWPIERSWRLLAYALVALLSLLPAVALVCIPLGYIVRETAWLFGLVSGIVAAVIWVSVFDWSTAPPSLLYCAEIAGLVFFSVSFSALGALLRNGARNTGRRYGDQ